MGGGDSLGVRQMGMVVLPSPRHALHSHCTRPPSPTPPYTPTTKPSPARPAQALFCKLESLTVGDGLALSFVHDGLMLALAAARPPALAALDLSGCIDLTDTGVCVCVLGGRGRWMLMSLQW